MKVLIYTTRPLSGAWVESLRQQISIVKTIAKEVDMLLMQKTNAGIADLEETTGVKINPVFYYRDEYHNNVVHLENWDEAYDAINVEPLLQYDHIIVFGGLLSHNSGTYRGGAEQNVFPYKVRSQINFLSVGSPKYHMLAIRKAMSEGVRVSEVVYDQQDFTIDLWHDRYKPKDHELYEKYHGYTDNEYGFVRLDSLQYYIDNTFLIEEPDTRKEVDFVFGYTIFTKDRKWVKEDVNEIASKFNNPELYIFNKLEKIDTSLPRKKYLERIAKARYTLCIPTYCKRSVSIYRVIESLWLDCLPVFHKDCNIGLLEDSFVVDLKDLIVTDDWFPLTEEARCDKIEQLKKAFCTYERGFL